MHLIAPPDWATRRELVLEGVSESVHAAIQQTRDRMLEAVQSEVQAGVLASQPWEVSTHLPRLFAAIRL